MQKQSEKTNSAYWWRINPDDSNQCSKMLRPGIKCPLCRRGYLAFNGLFLLTCPECNYIAESGAFT